MIDNHLDEVASLAHHSALEATRNILRVQRENLASDSETHF
jgi:hypothetical protein